MMKILAFLCCILTVANAQLSRSYANSTILDSSNGFKLSYQVQGSTLYIALQATLTNGASQWLGFGLAEFGGGSMKGGDLVSCAVSASGVASCMDYYVPWAAFTAATQTPSTLYPVPDTHQDWILVKSVITSTQITFELSRPLNTTDFQDRVIEAGRGNQIIWAHGSGNSMSYHGSNRGFTFINFVNTVTPSVPQYDGTVTFQFNNYVIPNVTTTYACQSFTYPLDKQRHAIAFEPVLSPQTEQYVHHMILYVCSNTTNYSPGGDYAPGSYFSGAPQRCFGDGPTLPNGVTSFPMQCNAVQYLYAHVNVPYILPPDVGFPIGPQDTLGIFDSYVVLETHYNNPDQVSNVQDSSGVKVYYTNTLRANHGGSLLLGDSGTNFPPLPDGNSAVHRQSNCPSVATVFSLGTDPSDYQTLYFQQQITSSLNVFGSFLHMHSHGRKIMTNQFDASGNFLRTTNRVDYWEGGFQKFQFQALSKADEFVINPGDSFSTHCYYDTTGSGSTPVPFGQPSSFEMCLDFLLYYPKVPGFDNCGWVKPDDNVAQFSSAANPGGITTVSTFSAIGLGELSNTFPIPNTAITISLPQTYDGTGLGAMDPQAARTYIDPLNFANAATTTTSPPDTFSNKNAASNLKDVNLLIIFLIITNILAVVIN